ncbi:glycoside hydrolase family 57 [Halochromatium salexigens]|uniref:Glycoside hydrolase family 57 n=1 Tax=Halochromatium salexigens TaxID=49447 RepID=A0AAJ0UCU2_HALSE|nr:glycoside hydrolase family 57 [Halochromatium salexigens]MBK5929169.1 glycoside hydrolase family 57 [Halochromatium salexigens]
MHTYHALVLNLHQPPGNLEHLLDEQTWEAQEILFALDRMPRSLWGQEDLARVHLSLSGTLLETLSNPEFQARVYGIVDCGKLLWFLQNQQIFDILSTGYYHPVLPLIPSADRPEHLRRWQGIAQHLFWRAHFHGFWPPEMGFSMELIPLLRRFGYRYVLVDSEHVEPVDSMSWQELRYRPHIARYGDDEIIVVVRDRELSDAQESGMDPGWFVNEVAERTRWCDFPPLVTTATDGENGGWFRNVTDGANYWSAFYLPLLDMIRAGDANLRPSFIHDYLDTHGAHGEVRVATGAWNTGWHHGKGFTQWTGSQTQRDVIARYEVLSQRLHGWLDQACAANANAGVEDLSAAEEGSVPSAAEASRDGHWGLSTAEGGGTQVVRPDQSVASLEQFEQAQAQHAAGSAQAMEAFPPSLRQWLEDAQWHLLRAETSCNIFWGEAWCYRAAADLDVAEQLLDQIDTETKRQ